MANCRPKREKYLVCIDDINEKMVLIEGSDTDYITPSGRVYKWYHDNMYYPKKAIQNNKNKYMYVSITFSDGINRQRRQHVLMAKAFIPNPDPEHLKIVGHKDDIKWHNTLDNLYWTDNQENTQSAINHKLNEQLKAEQNINSILIKVLDKNTNEIIGVYGSIRECDRCIENISATAISKMIRKNNYKPRSRKYVYQIANEEEFNANLNLRSKHLEENKPVNKNPKVFWLINDFIGYKKQFDNQTAASKVCNISQATISNMIKSGEILNGWRCEYIGEISYIDSSSYQNQLTTCDRVVLEHIKTHEIKTYNTTTDLLNDLHLGAHGIRKYLKNGNRLMNEWKVIAIESKENDIDMYSKEVQEIAN